MEAVDEKLPLQNFCVIICEESAWNAFHRRGRNARSRAWQPPLPHSTVLLDLSTPAVRCHRGLVRDATAVGSFIFLDQTAPLLLANAAASRLRRSLPASAPPQLRPGQARLHEIARSSLSISLDRVLGRKTCADQWSWATAPVELEETYEQLW